MLTRASTINPEAGVFESEDNARCAQLEAENKALRAAIAQFPERVTRQYYDDEIEDCPYCGSSWGDHDPQCIRNLIPGRVEIDSPGEMPDLSALGLRPPTPEPEEPPEPGSVKLPNGLTLSWQVD